VGVNFEAVKQDGIDCLKILSFLPGGPAERSGKLEVGDILYSIDNEVVYGTKLENVVTHFLGARGTVVTLGVIRAHSADIIRIQLKRESVPPQSGSISRVSLSVQSQ
jgi:carboxyl-terminal processing protease